MVGFLMWLGYWCLLGWFINFGVLFFCFVYGFFNLFVVFFRFGFLGFFLGCLEDVESIGMLFGIGFFIDRYDKFSGWSVGFCFNKMVDDVRRWLVW